MFPLLLVSSPGLTGGGGGVGAFGGSGPSAYLRLVDVELPSPLVGGKGTSGCP